MMTGARERNFAPDLSAPLCLAKYRLPDPGQFDILASDPAWWRIGCNSSAQVNHAARRRISRVAARDARAAAGDEFLISLGRNDRANLAQAFRGGLSE